MPYILCPDCGKKNVAKLPGEFTLTSWKKKYGDEAAPYTCTEANLWNDCVRAQEKKRQDKAKADEDAAFKASRQIALTLAEAQVVWNRLSTSADEAEKALLDKVGKFINGDDEFLVVDD